MEIGQRARLRFRWLPLIIPVIVACFWTVWHFTIGQVPVVAIVKMTPDWTLMLPIRISRWWDVLVGLIWSFIVLFIFANKGVQKGKNLMDILIFGPLIGLILGVTVGVNFSILYGLVVGLALSIVAGLFLGLTYGLIVVLHYDLRSGLFFGLTCILFFGLPPGLLFGLIFGIGFSLISGLSYGLTIVLVGLVSARFWRIIGKWLVAKQKSN